MSERFNTDKAYILGLLVAGGTVSSETFRIDFPLKNWGEDPNRMSEIARDFLSVLNKKFERAYDVSIVYRLGHGVWNIAPIEPVNIRHIIDDLLWLHLPISGVLLDNASLERLSGILSNLAIECFLSGFFDAKCSVTKSHRRFNDSAPTVSIEIPGSTKNFKLVAQLCQLITSRGSSIDQILYNHPCQHSSLNPTYRNWKKGFKIRFLVKSFLAQHSFVMRAKSSGVMELESLQTARQQVPCEERLSSGSPTSIHEDIHSSSLPVEVRSKLFFHHHHICAVLGCPYAPMSRIKEMVSKATDLTYAFPILKKGDFEGLNLYYKESMVLVFSHIDIKDEKILCEDASILYPKEDYMKIESALAFLFASRVRGTRPVGKAKTIISSNSKKAVVVYSFKDEEKSPLLLHNLDNGRAAIITSLKSLRNKDLIGKRLAIRGISVNVCK